MKPRRDTAYNANTENWRASTASMRIVYGVETYSAGSRDAHAGRDEIVSDPRRNERVSGADSPELRR